MIQMVPSSCVNQASPVPESNLWSQSNVRLTVSVAQLLPACRCSSITCSVRWNSDADRGGCRLFARFWPSCKSNCGGWSLPATNPKPPIQLWTLPLALQPGELVEVKSAAEIAATLDASNSLKGLTFLPAMTQFCGGRYTVQKRMERMFLEESGTLRKLKNTVLLKDVACDGLLMRCDRYCLFYWREAWLKRVQQ